MALVSTNQLRAARALVGWTQADLGKVVGVDQRQVRFWERRLPDNIRKRQKIIRAFRDAGVVLFSDPSPGVCVLRVQHSPTD